MWTRSKFISSNGFTKSARSDTTVCICSFGRDDKISAITWPIEVRSSVFITVAKIMVCRTGARAHGFIRIRESWESRSESRIRKSWGITGCLNGHAMRFMNTQCRLVCYRTRNAFYEYAICFTQLAIFSWLSPQLKNIQLLKERLNDKALEEASVTNYSSALGHAIGAIDFYVKVCCFLRFL